MPKFPVKIWRGYYYLHVWVGIDDGIPKRAWYIRIRKTPFSTKRYQRIV